MKRFEGRVAVVSGAAQGMGKAVALRLAQEGATVIAADINGKGAEATAKEIGGKSFGQQTDIGDPASVKALFDAVAAGGRISLLDLIRTLQDVLHSKAQPTFGPPREGDVRDSQADIEKARRHLDFSPAVAFEDGLQQTVAWFQSQHVRK